MTTTYKELQKITYKNKGGVNIPLKSFENNLTDLYKVDLNPLFQRDYVWTKTDSIAYIEWFLRTNDAIGVCPATTITLNRDVETDTHKLVDGKQRVNALLCFCRGELKVFNQYFKDFKFSSWKPDLYFSIVELQGNDLIDYYIAINSMGVKHTEEEIEKAKKLIIS